MSEGISIWIVVGIWTIGAQLVLLNMAVSKIGKILQEKLK